MGPQAQQLGVLQSIVPASANNRAPSDARGVNDARWEHAAAGTRLSYCPTPVPPQPPQLGVTLGAVNAPAPSTPPPCPPQTQHEWSAVSSEAATSFANACIALQGRVEWAGATWPREYDGYRIDPYATRRYGHMLVQKRNDFATWIRGEGPEPGPDGAMNCWEVLMYAAYRAGLVSKGWLVELHEQAASQGRREKSADAYSRTLRAGLGPCDLPTLPDSVSPPAGWLVFFNDLSHVAVSLGTRDPLGKREVLSLWMLPKVPGRSHTTLQRTTIEELLQAAKPNLDGHTYRVTSAPPTWVTASRR